MSPARNGALRAMPPRPRCSDCGAEGMVINGRCLDCHEGWIERRESEMSEDPEAWGELQEDYRDD